MLLALAGGKQHLHPRICPGVNCSRDPLGGQASSGPVQLQTLGHSSIRVCIRVGVSTQEKVLRSGCGDHGSLWDLGSPSHTQPGQDWQQQPLLPVKAISHT